MLLLAVSVCVHNVYTLTSAEEFSSVQLQLKEARQKIEELQRERIILTDDLSRSSKSLVQFRTECGHANATVTSLRSLLEEREQEKAELVARVTSQSAEMTALRDSTTEMRNKLSMAELLQQQVCVCVCTCTCMCVRACACI